MKPDVGEADYGNICFTDNWDNVEKARKRCGDQSVEIFCRGGQRGRFVCVANVENGVAVRWTDSRLR